MLLMGKLTISMAIFNSYFDITRGYIPNRLTIINHIITININPIIHQIIINHRNPTGMGSLLILGSRPKGQASMAGPTAQATNIAFKLKMDLYVI